MSWENYIESEVIMTDIEIAKHFIERDGLGSNSRKQELCYKRFFLYAHFYNKKGITLGRIGSLFGKHHATVIYGVKQWRILSLYPDVQDLVREYKIAFSTKSVFNESIINQKKGL